MTDVDVLRRWLLDDPRLLLLPALAAAAALVTCLCLDIHPPSFPAAIALSLARASPTQQQAPAPSTEQTDRKSTRSKERRRRGKDPFRDLLKSGKKSKVLFKTIKPTVDTLSKQIDIASSTSRSPSPEPASDLPDMDQPRLATHSDDDNASYDNAFVPSTADLSDQSNGIRIHTLSPDPMTAADTETNVSSASTVTAHAFEDASSSSPPISPAGPASSTPQPPDSQVAYSTRSCANLVRARTRLRLSKMDPGIRSDLLSSTPSLSSPDSVANSPNPIYSTTHSTDGTLPLTPTKSCESTPSPRSPQPWDQSMAVQLAAMRTALEAARVREDSLRLEAERASKERDELRWGWSEDASAWKRREAELQAHIHHLMQQLQVYAAAASFQAQQAPSGFSSPVSPRHSSPRLQHHPLVPFSLPPAIQAQNSASAPAHVQALLASAPMLTSHPPGYAVPPASLFPGTGFTTSPLLWSGLGLCVPKGDARHGGRRTPDSSPSGSSSRGRRRQPENVETASDESSLGDWDGVEDGSGNEDCWDEDEYIFRNNALADAILKRPESIRELSSAGKRTGGRPPTQGGTGERMDALKDPATENPGSIPPLIDTSAARS